MFKKYRDYLLVLAILIVSRLVLFGVGTFVEHGFHFADWVHWDSSFYLQIAEKGYDKAMPTVAITDVICNQGTGACQRNFAFFPGYPVAVSVFNAATGANFPAAGWIVSNLFFLGAGLLLYRLAKRLFDHKVAWQVLFLFAVYPFGYVFSAVMSESAFLFLLLLAYSLAQGRHYLWAGIAGLTVAATRNTGILFVLPLILVYLEQQHQVKWGNVFKKMLNWKLIVAGILTVTGLGLFMYFLYTRTGDPLAFISVQKYWEKPVLGLNPLLAIPFSFIDYRLEGAAYIHLLNLAVFTMLAGLFVFSWKKKILPWSLNNIFLWILVPLTAGSMLALPRYSAVIFPLYLVGGVLLSKYSKLKYLILPVLFTAQITLTYMYIRGSWLTV